MQPNILYLFTDQQHHRAMRCAGNPDVATPAMDRLAREGVRFENAYCAFPLCTPSRACMFSGLWPHQSGVVWNEQSMNRDARENGLGNLLARAGYDCAYGGKWHIPWCAAVGDNLGYHYTHPRVPFIVPGDEYAPDAGGLPAGVPMSEPPKEDTSPCPTTASRPTARSISSAPISESSARFTKSKNPCRRNHS